MAAMSAHMRRQTVLAAVVLLAASFFAGGAEATDPDFDCNAVSCHILAECVAQDTCGCQAGTLDVNGDASVCEKNGYAIRYVLWVDYPNSAHTNSPAVIQAAMRQINQVIGANIFCRAGAKGSFGRSVPDIFSDDNVDGVDRLELQAYWLLEVNCLYPEKPTQAELDMYSVNPFAIPPCEDNLLDCLFSVKPAIYSWTLPTTAAPMRVPPTGMEVTSVNFLTNCESSGCWSIKGVITDGNGFNTWDAFNTFFLPLAESPSPTGTLSYDYPYTAEAWTFEPRNHPCTSAQYQADGAAGLSRVSTCCIDNDSGGSFIDNYRTSTAFEDWAKNSLNCNSFTSTTVENVGANPPPPPPGSSGGETVQSIGDNSPPLSFTSTRCWNKYGPNTSPHKGSVTWDEANAKCKELNGSLVSIHNEIEEAVFHEMADWIYWTGLTDPGTGAGVSWSDGSTYDHFVTVYSCHQHLGYDRNNTPWCMGKAGVHTGPDADSGVIPPDRDLFPNNQSRSCVLGGSSTISFKYLTAEYPCDHNAFYMCDLPREDHEVCDSDLLNSDKRRAEVVQGAGRAHPFDVPFPNNYMNFLQGPFKGMSATSGVVNLTMTDPFFGQYDFEIRVDEVELRSLAGQLRGTVGVEYTVDTFLGLANFRPTGVTALDTFATQTNIHLEKTNFFSVSTHGVNEYTFLEYVNMRLVQVLKEDADFSGDSESADRTVRTNTAGNAAYVQVTFTMGPQYQPNESGGLIPLDSVRAGMGTFFDEVNDAGELEHLCQEYNAAADGANIGLTYDGTADGDSRGTKETFRNIVDQLSCGPQASMCASPDSVPDQFVSFNIPLGFEVFDGQASSQLNNNIFVDFVVNAIDTDARDKDVTNPNGGQAPWQMKTTLTASIPIVDGGINIFCDGFTAKTDLKDVANVDIVVGSAADKEELTRLRILQDIASTDLDVVASSRIDTPSIESGLMTLVIKGNESYFSPDTTRNTIDYTMELDDVITLHLMEDGDAGTAATNTKEAEVVRLLNDVAGEDNTDSTGLITEGYKLNGAFYFTVNRAMNTASLEPTDELLAVCPFNPPRPDNSVSLESCILRRDVQKRGYPSRTGAEDTAMEILAASRIDSDAATENVQPTLPQNCDEAMIDTAAEELDETSEESEFLARIFGDNDYAKALAPDFARAIHERYALNGRFRRAFWINPGYEWTPTQTRGRSIFSVSQKIYLFALISLDENWTRRRMLLQTSSNTLADRDAGMNQAKLEFEVTPVSMMASAFGVPEDRVAQFDVELQLTMDQACMSPAELQNDLRLTLVDYLDKSASKFLTVQVMSLEVTDSVGVQCPGSRRGLRKLLQSGATATIKMLIVFDKGAEAKFNEEKFRSMAGVNSVDADARNSPKISITTDLDCSGDACGEVESSEGGGGSSVDAGLIGGIVGGVVAGVALLGVGIWMMMRRREPDTVMAVQTVNIEDLKNQLSQEV